MNANRSNGRELRGSMTAMVTPFTHGEIDWERIGPLVDRQIEGGTDWLVVSGTTGETPTMTHEEDRELLKAVLDHVSGRCHVMAGTGSNCTREAVASTKAAAAIGAEAALVVTPYYNRPTQEGLFRHYVEVAKAADLPIVIYNVPVRTGVSIENETILRLHDARPNIVAVKDAGGKPENATELRTRSDIVVLSGDDSLTWPFMSRGAVGVISVISNLCPDLMKSLVTAALSGDTAAATKAHAKVKDLADALARFGPNPIPIKTAMAIAGLLDDEFRLPLCPLATAARDEIEGILRRHGVLDAVAL